MKTVHSLIQHTSFDRAIIRIADSKIVEGTVKSWKGWDDSDMIQVELTDGKIYYTHSSNVILIKEG